MSLQIRLSQFRPLGEVPCCGFMTFAFTNFCTKNSCICMCLHVCLVVSLKGDGW